uniref:Ribosomal protein L4 n=2 Tax=Babesia TaxID=5864 RepID=A0A411AD95_9APIC|nr:ribosomal protein L4 [Babesia sp. Lintan]QAX27026.1 ribosomal protein L4 [Babesia motasi]QAX27057.1 ribosomal protein L4 [Babesia motasi]
MINILLKLNFYFNTKLINYTSNILMCNLYKNNLTYKNILIYLKNILKRKIFNLKNKYNSTKSRNKKSKTYHSSSHTVRKGLVWFGLRNLYLHKYRSEYKNLLLSMMFNFRSNIIITNLECIKFLYYIKGLNSNYFKLVLNNSKYLNYIANSNENLLYKKNNTNINLIH